jgi:GTP-binding protein
MAQIKARPPTFVLFASRADQLPDTYRRYLINSLRESFDLPGVPIRITIKSGANPYAETDETDGRARPQTKKFGAAKPTIGKGAPRIKGDLKPKSRTVIGPGLNPVKPRAAAGPKPFGRPGAKPFGTTTGGKPGGKPGGRTAPGGRAAGRPTGGRPGGRPTGKR